MSHILPDVFLWFRKPNFFVSVDCFSQILRYTLGRKRVKSSVIFPQLRGVVANLGKKHNKQLKTFDWWQIIQFLFKLSFNFFPFVNNYKRSLNVWDIVGAFKFNWQQYKEVQGSKIQGFLNHVEGPLGEYERNAIASKTVKGSCLNLYNIIFYSFSLLLSMYQGLGKVAGRKIVITIGYKKVYTWSKPRIILFVL